MTSKRQKKAGWLLPDVIDVSETQSFCVTIPAGDRYRNAFIGAINLLLKWWNWEKSYLPGDERAKEAAQLWRNVMTFTELDNCIGGDDMQIDFRDNPEDNCEVQYSTDGGEAWNTAWRKDNCISVPENGTSIAIINISETTIIDNNITYDGDIINIAVNWEYTGVPADDDLLDIALCWAIHKHVDLICDVLKRQLDDGNWLIKAADNFMADLMSLANSVASNISVFGVGPNEVLVQAVSWAATKIWEDIIGAASLYDSELLNDQNARQAVACWMFEEIRGDTPQFVDWSPSLSGFFPGNDAQTMISEAVIAVNASEDHYVNWLTMLESVTTVAESLPVCPCPSTWSHTWNFRTHGSDTWVIENLLNPSQEAGVFVDDSGAECRHVVVGNGFHRMSVNQLLFNEDVPRLTGLGVLYDAVRGDWDENTNFMNFIRQGKSNFGLSQGGLSTGTNQVRFHDFGAEENLDGVGYAFNVASYDPGPQQNNGSGTIISVTLYGNGNDPFAGRITS